jgi:hypothetical protein
MLPLPSIGTGKDFKMENDLNRTIKASELLNEANSVRQERGLIYGNPYYNMETTAKLVSAYINTYITPDQMAVILALVKIARLAQTSGFENKDSYVDGISYLSIAGECSTYQEYLNDDDYS